MTSSSSPSEEQLFQYMKELKLAESKKEEEIQIQKARERIWNARGCDINRFHDHECRAEYCDAQNELHFILIGTLEAPAIHNDVFVCKFGKMHICTADQCKHTYSDSGLRRCCVTGRDLGSEFSTFSRDAIYGGGGGQYDNQDGSCGDGDESVEESRIALRLSINKTLSASSLSIASPIRKRRLRHRNLRSSSYSLGHSAGGCESNEALYIKALSIIRKLLSTQRIAEENKLEKKKVAIDIITKYHQEIVKKRCEIPNIHFVIHTFLDMSSTPSQPHKQFKEAYYARSMMYSWNIVTSSPWAREGNIKPNFEIFALGFLYIMRSGYYLEGCEMIPQDSYVSKHFPAVNDLRSYGFEKKNVTVGVNMIQNAYSSALKTRPHTSLRMGVGMYRVSGNN